MQDQTETDWDVGCKNGICASIAFFPVAGVSAPLALFIVSSLPVGFLLFFLWRANINYKQAWKKNTNTTKPRASEIEDYSMSLSMRRNRQIQEAKSKTSLLPWRRRKTSTVPLYPFYYSFIQFISLIYSLNFILRGFFSGVRAVDMIVLPILFCVLEISEFLVIGFLFMKSMNRKSKIIGVIVSALFAGANLAIRLALELEGVPVLKVSCKKNFAIYWMAYHGFFSVAYAAVIALRYTKYKDKVRQPVIVYAGTLLVLSIVDVVAAALFYLKYDAGICLWLIGYIIFYGLYAPVLYYTLSRDSMYWYEHLRRQSLQQFPSTERAPLLTQDKLNVGLDKEWIIPWHELIIGQSIGRGGYGEVCIAEWRDNTVAVKKLFYKNMSDKDYEEFKMECHILSSLHHPNILQMIGACIEVPNLAIVTEYMPLGNLQDLLYDKTVVLQWKVRLQIAQDIAKGVAYLHSLKPCIIHRDLKSSNLLVGERYQTKVSDFGIARFKEERTMTMVGTVQWTAPEVLQGKRYSSSIDTYSFGIILWEIIVRQQPHEGLLSFEIISGVAQGGLRPPVPENAPEDYKELMRACWAEIPADRPTFDTIVTRLHDMIINEELQEWE